MKMYTNELGHITNMAAMPIYGKNLKKGSLQSDSTSALFRLRVNVFLLP